MLPRARSERKHLTMFLMCLLQVCVHIYVNTPINKVKNQTVCGSIWSISHFSVDQVADRRTFFLREKFISLCICNNITATAQLDCNLPFGSFKSKPDTGGWALIGKDRRHLFFVLMGRRVKFHK